MFTRILKLTLAFSFITFVVACAEDEDREGEILNSSWAASASHTDARRGNNCRSCHAPGGGLPVFTVAGTVYDVGFTSPTPVSTNATINQINIELASDAAFNTIVATIQVDGNGNFYTGESISPAGLYARVVDVDETVMGGDVHFAMTDSLTHGDCNLCHTGANNTDNQRINVDAANN